MKCGDNVGYDLLPGIVTGFRGHLDTNYRYWSENQGCGSGSRRGKVSNKNTKNARKLVIIASLFKFLK